MRKNLVMPLTVLLVFNGEYDLASREQVRAAVDSVADASTLVLDFSDVTYIDSTVISELVRLHNARTAKGLPRATVVVNNDNILRLFEILQLKKVFLVVRALDDGVGRDNEAVVHYVSAFDHSTARCNDFAKDATG